LTQRRSSHRITAKAVGWEIFDRIGPCFVAVALLLTPFAPFIRGIQAQTLPAPSALSNNTKQSQEREPEAESETQHSSKEE
jgi:hypothetical protein